MGLGPSSSRPVAVSPPFWGWVCFGGLAGVVVHLRDAWRGFLAWWACWLLSWKFIFLFRAACLYAGCLGFSASFLPGEGSWFLRLAWRYGCCFWRRPFPYPWCFSDAGGTVSVSTFLGWFAILGGSCSEVPGLPVSPGLLRFSRGALSSGFPIQWPPSEGGFLVLQFVVWGSRAPPDIWPRASVSLLAFDLLVAWSLRLWGDPCLGVKWLSFRVRVLCPLLRRVDVARRDLPCSSVGGFTVPARSTRD